MLNSLMNSKMRFNLTMQRWVAMNLKKSVHTKIILFHLWMIFCVNINIWTCEHIWFSFPSLMNCNRRFIFQITIKNDFSKCKPFRYARSCPMKTALNSDNWNSPVNKWFNSSQLEITKKHFSIQWQSLKSFWEKWDMIFFHV